MELLDTTFTLVFTAELLINAYAHWFRRFVRDGWNIFDSLVVALSLIALGPVAMPINVLRSLRAFRVVRLFGRMGTLRDIISSLTAAIFPVLNAFLVLLLITSICECDRHPVVSEFFLNSQDNLVFTLQNPFSISQTQSSERLSSVHRPQIVSASSDYRSYPFSAWRLVWVGHRCESMFSYRVLLPNGMPLGLHCCICSSK